MLTWTQSEKLTGDWCCSITLTSCRKDPATQDSNGFEHLDMTSNGRADKLEQVQQAYEVLGNLVKRRLYDAKFDSIWAKWHKHYKDLGEWQRLELERQKRADEEREAEKIQRDWQAADAERRRRKAESNRRWYDKKKQQKAEQRQTEAEQQNLEEDRTKCAKKRQEDREAREAQEVQKTREAEEAQRAQQETDEAERVRMEQGKSAAAKEAERAEQKRTEERERSMRETVRTIESD